MIFEKVPPENFLDFFSEGPRGSSLGMPHTIAQSGFPGIVTEVPSGILLTFSIEITPEGFP